MNKAQKSYFELGFAYADYLNLKGYAIMLNNQNQLESLEYIKKLNKVELQYAIRYMALKHKEAMKYSNKIDNDTKVELRKLGKRLYNIIDNYRVIQSQNFGYILAQDIIGNNKNINQIIMEVISDVIKRSRLGYGGIDLLEKFYHIYKSLIDKCIKNND